MLDDWTVDELMKLRKLCGVLFIHPEALPFNQDNEIGTRIAVSNLSKFVFDVIEERIS